MNKSIIFIVLFTLSFGATSETTSFRNAKDYVASVTLNKNKTTYEVLLGDLNNDGRSDMALIIHTARAGQDNDQIVLLLGTKDNSFRPWLNSKISSLNSSNLTAKLEKIKNNSLFVYLEGTRGFWGTYQFKLRNNAMQLIGAKVHLAECSTGNDDCKSVDTDIDFLTGEIHINQEMPIKARSLGKAIFSPCYFGDFDFNPYFCMENIKTSKGILDYQMRGEHQPSTKN